MPATSRTITVEELAKAITRLSPKEYESLIELLDKENLKKRRALAHRQITKRQIVTERALFKGIG